MQKVKFLSICSGITLFGISAAFGFLDKPTEMGMAIAAGSLGFIFSNFDRLLKVKGPGFEAEYQEAISADTVVTIQTDQTEQLKSLTYEIGPTRQNIMSALLHMHFNSRYIDGIAAETDISKEVIEGELAWLLNAGLVKRSILNPYYIWNLTEKGMALLPMLYFGKQRD